MHLAKEVKIITLRCFVAKHSKSIKRIRRFILINLNHRNSRNHPNFWDYWPRDSVYVFYGQEQEKYVRSLFSKIISQGYGKQQLFDCIVEMYLELDIEFLDAINFFHHEITTSPWHCCCRLSTRKKLMYISHRSSLVLERIAVGMLFDNLSNSASYLIDVLHQHELEKYIERIPKRISVDPVATRFDVLTEDEPAVNGYTATKIGWLEQQRLRKEEELHGSGADN